MKRYVRYIFAVLFLAAAAAILWFLHLFTQVSDTLVYIDWESSVSVAADGTEEEFDWESYGSTQALSGTYRFSGTIPDGLSDGHLLFETAGLDLTLELNGKEIYHSDVPFSENGAETPQASIPLTAGTEGVLSMTCRVSEDGAYMFPPLVRFIPEYLETVQDTAFANRAAFPAGAAALALLLSFGIFLTGILIKEPDLSLIPLMFALGGMMIFRLSQSEGVYFLPRAAADALGRWEISLMIVLSLLLYLTMNRKRRFWRRFGLAAVWSAAALLTAGIISVIFDGYLAYYLREALIPELKAGYYEGFLYWATMWLSFTAAMISAYGAMSAFGEKKAQAQSLRVRNTVIMNSYRELEERIKKRAREQHEWRHRLSALDCLLQEKDYEKARKTVCGLLKKQEALSPVFFTENPAVNMILLDASQRAEQLGIRFQAYCDIPRVLSIPDADLFCLLMNMLENALEAASRTADPRGRYISIRIRLTENENYLAVKCENSYTGPITEDKAGNLLTSKGDPEFHGFGIRQMTEIAERYSSSLLISHEPGKAFVVQTALLLPGKKH